MVMLHRVVWGTLLGLLLLAAGCWTLPAVAAAPAAPITDQGLCALLPQGPPAPVPAGERPGIGVSASCVLSWPTGNSSPASNGDIRVQLFLTPDAARAVVTGGAGTTPAGEQWVSEGQFGEAGTTRSEENSDGTYSLKNLLFSRGCYEVEGTPGRDANEHWVAPDQLYQYAAQVDQNLKALATPCPTAFGTAAEPAANANPGPISIGLACDPSQLQEAGQVLCTASVANPRPDAQLTYAWTLDSQAQAETSDTLSLSGIQAGTSHTVTVSATDTKNNLSTDFASTSFTGNPVGSSGGAAPGAPQLGV